MNTSERSRSSADFDKNVKLFRRIFIGGIAVAVLLRLLLCANSSETAGKVSESGLIHSDAGRRCPASITAATWNIRWFPSGFPGTAAEKSEKKTIAAAGAVIGGIEPSVICLQEMRDRKSVDLLAEATGLRGLKVAVCSEFPVSAEIPVGQQEAILTTLPVEDAGYERWHSSGYVDPPRGYAYAVLTTPAGPVAVYSIHLKSNYVAEDQDEYKAAKLNRLKRELASKQIRAVADGWMKKNSGRNPRVIIAGDFNTSRGEDRWKDETTLTGFDDDGYTSCFSGMKPFATATVPKSEYNSAVTFDYIMHKGFSGQETTRIHAKQWVSDHRMVSVELLFR